VEIREVRESEEKGQVSVELLIILGTFMLILLPIIIFAFSVSVKENWKISLQRDRDTLLGLAKSADQLVTIGKDNSAHYTAYFSSQAKNLTHMENILILKEEVPGIDEVIDQVVILNKGIVLKYWNCTTEGGSETCTLTETNSFSIRGLSEFNLNYNGEKIVIIKE